MVLEKHDNRNEVEIFVDEEHKEQVVEVRRVNNGMMSTKLVIGESTLNIVSAYATAGRLGRRGEEELLRGFR